MPEAVQALFLPVDLVFEPDFVFEADFDFEPDFELCLADLLSPFDFEPRFAEALLLSFDFELCFAEVLQPDFAPDFCLVFRLVLELPFATEPSLFRLDLAAASCLRPPLSLIPAPVDEVLLFEQVPLSRKTIHRCSCSCISRMPDRCLVPSCQPLIPCSESSLHRL